MRARLSFAAAIAIAGLTAACDSQMKMGTDQGPVTGSTGPNGTTASAQLEHCDRPLGVMTLTESQIPGLAQYGLSSPVPVLRLLIQQSGCFQVVDRGQAFQNIQQERALTQAGETRGGSNFGGGQLVAADLALTPNIIFSGNTGGGGAGAALSFIPYVGGLASAVAGSVKFTSAQSVLTVTDVRSGMQISAAEGTATARDMNLGAALFGVSGGGALGGYSNTPEGKVVSASLMDAYNNVVRTVRGMPPLRSAGGAAGARAYVANGNLNIRGTPSTNGEVIGKLTPGTVVSPTGTTQGGWWEVSAGDQRGWVLGSNLHQQ